MSTSREAGSPAGDRRRSPRDTKRFACHPFVPMPSGGHCGPTRRSCFLGLGILGISGMYFGRSSTSRGIPSDPSDDHGLFHKLRRSAISYAARTSLENARRLAGHSNVNINIQHYIDPLIAQEGQQSVLPVVRLPAIIKPDRQLRLPGF